MNNKNLSREFLLPTLEDLPYYTRIVDRLGGSIVNHTLVKDEYGNYSVTFNFPNQSSLSIFRRDELLLRGKG